MNIKKPSEYCPKESSLYDYLGHFRQSKFLDQGHNDSKYPGDERGPADAFEANQGVADRASKSYGVDSVKSSTKEPMVDQGQEQNRKVYLKKMEQEAPKKQKPFIKAIQKAGNFGS